MSRWFALMLALAEIGSAAGALAAPEEIDAQLEHARQALARGDSDLALRLAREAVKDYPKEPRCFAQLGAIHDVRREFDRAIDAYSRVVELLPAEAEAYERRGEDYFRVAKFKQSVADFDKVLELEPARAPYHWQRGLSLYYAGDFAGGAKQFELHRTVNPEDVENAAWHFLCVARAQGLDEARKTLIPIHADARPPMMEVFALFAGRASPDDVLAAAHVESLGADAASKLRFMLACISVSTNARWAMNRPREHLRKAAELAPHDYMGDLARVEALLLKQPADVK